MNRLGELRAGARRLLDRAVAPYVDLTERRIDLLRDELVRMQHQLDEAAPASAPSDLTSDTFHQVLHELRTCLLRRSAGTYDTVLSVGASGRWYFDWFEASVGPVTEHIGVEAFEPEPDDLPAYATWIDSTADRFPGVADDTVDLVFAGQTTEHLWPDELTGFLLESNRVLRDGGTIVADSPNRLVTEHLSWSHGGHTLELSAAEMAELLELAGFSITSTYGAWCCRYDGAVHELEEDIERPAVLTRRIADGLDVPDEAFVWWITAQRDAAPRAEALHNRVEQLFDEHWSTRICRGMWPGPGHAGPEVPAGPLTEIARSLPMYLRPGTWQVLVELDEGDWSDVEELQLDITAPGGHLIHRAADTDFHPDGSARSAVIQHEELILALSVELSIAATAPVRVKMPLRIAPAV